MEQCEQRAKDTVGKKETSSGCFCGGVESHLVPYRFLYKHKKYEFIIEIKTLDTR